MDQTIKTNLETVKKRLDVVSPSMCVAKWNQVTVHLGTGTTHSCHHPMAHKIPIEELKDNPSALHNTNFKKKMRKKMLEGERPAECDYCWRVEDSKKEKGDSVVYSDRITKSAEVWAEPHLDRITSLPWDADINPTYLEIDFDTTCNFKCAYCSPLYSTTWMQEIKKFGAYNLPSTQFNSVAHLPKESMPILQSEHNPYIEAFWLWFPSAVKDLHTFRITGGEPLLSNHTFKVLDYLIANPQPNLSFNINSNLGVPAELIDRLIDKMKTIQQMGAIKDFKLFTSAEAHGKRAEYTRFGLDYDQWVKNIDRVLSEIPDSKVTIMCTFNLLSVTSFLPFLKDMLALKLKHYDRHTRQLPLAVDVPYLRFPEFMAAWLLTEDFLKYIEECVTFMYRNREVSGWAPLAACGFYEHEIHRMERLYYLIRDNMGNTDANWASRKNFYAFVTEYDRRRNTNFLETFPELVGFYYLCRDGG